MADKLMTREEFEKQRESLLGRASLFAVRVAPLYMILNWRWLDAPAPPTAEEIEANIREKINRLNYDTCWHIRSGRIKVSICEEEGDNGYHSGESSLLFEVHDIQFFDFQA